MLAHVNAFGQSVPISVRAAGMVTAGEAEQEAFAIHEGAFFGSLAEGRVHSCWALPPDEALALSQDRSRRVCTDIDDRCEIESLGDCRSVCSSYSEVDGFSDCVADGRSYPVAFNTFLRDDAVVEACGL
jgi:hypothetical protein